MQLLRRFSAWQQRLRRAQAHLIMAPVPRAVLGGGGFAAAGAARASPRRTARATATATATAAGERLTTVTTYPPPASAYVHLPFCRRKCFYCDFPVEAIGGGKGAAAAAAAAAAQGAAPSSSPPDPAATSPRAAARIRAYVDLVLREIDATARLLGPERGASSMAASKKGDLLHTVYFGGGTPSLVPPAMVAEIVRALDARFGVAPAAEVTLEADPGTFDGARLREYCAPRRTGQEQPQQQQGGGESKSGGGNAGGGGGNAEGGGGAGVTRLSVGVQAFQDALLEACGRSHSLGDVREAVAAVRAAIDDPSCGLRSWSLDLICGLPGLTREAWADSLAQAVATGAGHVSVYDLQVEEGTPFARWYGGEKEGGGGSGKGSSSSRSGSSSAAPKRRGAGAAAAAGDNRGDALPDEDAGTAMYEQASEALRAAGYERYELSNYALLVPAGGGGGSGFGSGKQQQQRQQEQQRPPATPASPNRSAHNQCYWRGAPYLAFGLGAASYVRGVRYSRPRDMRAYERWVASLEEAAAGAAATGATTAAAGATAAPLASAGAGALWAPGLPHDAHVETQHDRLLDRFMLALRTSDGLDLSALAREHGAEAVLRALPALEAAAARGLAELRPAAAAAPGASSPPPLPYEWARLTDPQGLMMSNDVISDVFALLS